MKIRSKKLVYAIALSLVTSFAFAGNDNYNYKKRLSKTKVALCEVYQGMIESDKTGFTEMPKFCPSVPPKYVFVTSGAYNANMGGVEGAHAICQKSADGAYPPLPGVYKAWIAGSHAATSPIFTHTRSISPYILSDGTVVADNWADLVDGMLAHEIFLDENGVEVFPKGTWTNVKIDGMQFSSSTSCSDWRSTSSSEQGYVGNAGHMDRRWTQMFTLNGCHTLYRLYCIQQ